MSEAKPIKHADLAHHWGCSAPNVSNLVKRKGMPEFTSLAAADAWRAVNAPARKARQTSRKTGTEVGGKNARVTDTTTRTTTGAAGGDEGDSFALSEDASRDPSAAETRARAAAALAAGNAPQRINVEEFINRERDFTELMLEQAKEAPQIVYGLLKRTMAAGEPGAIAAASRNWHEAAGHAADVLERFIKIQQASGALLSIDDVADVLLSELQEVRKNFKRLGQRYAAIANPADPALAQRAFDAAVDAALAPGDAALERVRLELAVPVDAAPAQPAAAS